MTQEQAELANRIRRRAFLSRNVHAARKLLQLADEVRARHFLRPPIAMLQLVKAEDPPMADWGEPTSPPPPRCAAFWDGEAKVCLAPGCRGCPKVRADEQDRRQQRARARSKRQR